MTEMYDRLKEDGYFLIRRAVETETIAALIDACQAAFAANRSLDLYARSSQGNVYAARNLLEEVPLLRTFWRSEPLSTVLKDLLGDRCGLVRVLYFDKPPDRTWALPWHKDQSIAVKDNSLKSPFFSRPTTKRGVPHVIAADEVLQEMLTLRVHLDEVTEENGPLRVIPRSHQSSSSEGLGAERSVTILAEAGDVLAMRPLITHCSGVSRPDTLRHRRIVHLEFAPSDSLTDNFRWHEFIPLFDQVPLRSATV